MPPEFASEMVLCVSCGVTLPVYPLPAMRYAPCAAMLAAVGKFFFVYEVPVVPRYWIDHVPIGTVALVWFWRSMYSSSDVTPDACTFEMMTGGSAATAGEANSNPMSAKKMRSICPHSSLRIVRQQQKRHTQQTHTRPHMDKHRRFARQRVLTIHRRCARVELCSGGGTVYTPALGAGARKGLRVRISPRAKRILCVGSSLPSSRPSSTDSRT